MMMHTLRVVEALNTTRQSLLLLLLSLFVALVGVFVVVVVVGAVVRVDCCGLDQRAARYYRFGCGTHSTPRRVHYDIYFLHLC